MKEKPNTRDLLMHWSFIATAIVVSGCRSESNFEAVDVQDAEFSSPDDYQAYDESLHQLAEGQSE